MSHFHHHARITPPPHVERHRQRARTLALSLFPDPADTDSAVDGILHDAAGALPHGTPSRAVEAWVLHAVVVRAEQARTDAARERARHERRVRDVAVPSRAIADAAARGELASLLRHLPAREADAFAMRYLERATLADMSHRLGASPGLLTHRLAAATARPDALLGGGSARAG